MTTTKIGKYVTVIHSTAADYESEIANHQDWIVGDSRNYRATITTGSEQKARLYAQALSHSDGSTQSIKSIRFVSFGQ